MPTAAHVIYIPVMLMIGIVIGHVLATRAAREAQAAEEARKARRAARRAAGKDAPTPGDEDPNGDGPSAPAVS